MMNEQEEDNDADTASPLDHLFSALKHFARAGATRGSGSTARAGKGDAAGADGRAAAARFGTVKKSCCVAKK
jgi:hypothetical protein